jgi:hypothetical protein
MGCLVLLVALFSLGLLGTQQWVTPLAMDASPMEATAIALPLYQDETGVLVSRFEVARDLDADGYPVDQTMRFRRSEAVSVDFVIE